MQLEQTVPPPRSRSPALRGPPSPRSATNLRSRQQQTAAGPLLQHSTTFPLVSKFSGEVRGLRRNHTQERTSRSLSPRSIERPRGSGHRARTPPALEPMPSALSSAVAGQRSFLLPNDADTSLIPPPLSFSNAPSPSASPEMRAGNSEAFRSRSSTLPTTSPSTPRASQQAGNRTSPTSPPPRSSLLADLSKIGSPRAHKTPRKPVPSMCDYLSLEELENMWCAQDQYAGCSIVLPEKPRGRISMEKILEVRALMPEEELGVHPMFRKGGYF